MSPSLIRLVSSSEGKIGGGGAWVAQKVEDLTLDFGSGGDREHIWPSQP